jgi:hypothetical protein
MRSRVIAFTVLAMFVCHAAFAQQPAGNTGESHKYRTMFTFIGLGGGVAAGLFGGLAAFDDAPHAESKITLTMILSGAGGAVGGYFIGRALDKPSKTTTVTWLPAGRTYPPVESLGILPSVFKTTSRVAAKPQPTSCLDQPSTTTVPKFELVVPDHIGTIRSGGELDCRRVPTLTTSGATTK